jgi:mRNA-degrading endonuclease RelE of RelBE toxin-antitoxin system
MTYRVVFTRQSRRYFELAPRDLALRISEVLKTLQTDAHPFGSCPLKGELAGFFSMRVGHVRLVYECDEASREITILRIGPRGDVY